MFVVDDLVGWLIGQLADAGYHRLVTLVRGSDQARALKQAVTAAVQATVGEIGCSDEEQADRAAEQINKAFRRRDPVALPPGQPTLLEALQAGIAGQLSVLDNAVQPAVTPPGVPVSEMAAKLTGHLVREIQTRGSRGGALTDLADQLNHDVTHLQGQRLEGMLAQVLDWLGHGLASPGGAAGPAGWPLAQVVDPFALEVHRPLEPDAAQPGLPVLPAYVPREHDRALVAMVIAAAAGTSGMAVLVGGSSTGKTRACWQALESLRGQEPEWRLWHPVDPPAALAQLPGVGPRTVVWLNEAQRCLGPADGTGERAAAGLRELLGPGRGPVLVLATLWPEFWNELAARLPGGEDPHAQARELLSGRDIPVPAAFTDEQLRELEAAADPRLAQAAAASRDGQVIQYLAGAPELLARYRNAPPAARALIDAAVDARRLGMGPALPRAFLEAAAPGYLTDTDWDLLPDDWLEQALDYTAKPSKGIRGPLTPIRPRPGRQVPAGLGGGPSWQLADYLDQNGRHARRELIPPPAFWAAAGSYADPADLDSLGWAAVNRGLDRDAARLFKQASTHGDPTMAGYLVALLLDLYPGDQRPASWAVAHASLDNPAAVALLLNLLREAGATGQVTTLLDRDPAAHASLDHPGAVAMLLNALGEAGAVGQVTTLASRAAHASLDHLDAVAWLLVALGEAGATGQVTTLASRAVAHASLDNPGAVDVLLRVLGPVGATGQLTTLLDRDPAGRVSLDNLDAVGWLLRALREVGAAGQVTTLASRAAAHASLDDLDAVAMLLNALGEVGAAGQVTTLASRAAAHASLDHPDAVARLLHSLLLVGAADQVTTLLDRDPATYTSLEHPGALAELLRTLRLAGAAGQVTTLLDRDPADRVSLDNLDAVAGLLRALREVGAAGQVATLASRAAAHASLDHPGALAELLRTLREAEATGQVTTLLDRDPAGRVRLDNPGAVAWLLDELREAGAGGQVTTLTSRAVAHASLDHPGAVARLLDSLRLAGAAAQVTALLDRDPAAHVSLDKEYDVTSLLEALRQVGAIAQAAELIDRLPAAGKFQLFCEQDGRGEQFRFGRQVNGHPAKPWSWTDLG